MRYPKVSAYESVTVSSTAVGLTPPTVADSASITTETDQIRFCIDGTTATSTVGHLVDARSSIELESKDEIEKFSAIRITADAALKVTYYVGVRRP